MSAVAGTLQRHGGTSAPQDDLLSPQRLILLYPSVPSNSVIARPRKDSPGAWKPHFVATSAEEVESIDNEEGRPSLNLGRAICGAALVAPQRHLQRRCDPQIFFTSRLYIFTISSLPAYILNQLILPLVRMRRLGLDLTKYGRIHRVSLPGGKECRGGPQIPCFVVLVRTVPAFFVGA